MMKPILTAAVIKKLNAIVDQYKFAVQAPIAGNWKAMGDSELWASVLIQIAVVGNAATGKSVQENLKDRVEWYAKLVSMKPSQRLKEIHSLLRQAGVRYAATDINMCKKSEAAHYNFMILTSYGGPKSYFRQVATISHEAWRIAAVADDLAYLKNKGARDLLIGLGLIERAIAFDTRLVGILRHLGANLPNDLVSSKPKYKALETELIERVCKPKEITGGHFDRILFRNYKKIMP
jgi:hypothetical protein